MKAGRFVMGSVSEVIEAFLGPMLSQQYEKVCRWIDWPGRNGEPDTGIDRVACERDLAECTGIQTEFYEPICTLTKGDIGSFFTASGNNLGSNRRIISITDRWGKNAEDTLGRYEATYVKEKYPCRVPLDEWQYDLIRDILSRAADGSAA
jgi:predicted helicase